MLRHKKKLSFAPEKVFLQTSYFLKLHFSSFIAIFIFCKKTSFDARPTSTLQVFLFCHPPGVSSPPTLFFFLSLCCAACPKGKLKPSWTWTPLPWELGSLFASSSSFSSAPLCPNWRCSGIVFLLLALP